MMINKVIIVIFCKTFKNYKNIGLNIIWNIYDNLFINILCLHYIIQLYVSYNSILLTYYFEYKLFDYLITKRLL